MLFNPIRRLDMHSSPLSEVAAHLGGLIVGIATYAMAGAVTRDHKLRIEIGMVASVIGNALIGGKINLLMRDFISLIIVRPISAFLGAKLLEYVANTISGT